MNALLETFYTETYTFLGRIEARILLNHMFHHTCGLINNRFEHETKSSSSIEKIGISTKSREIFLIHFPQKAYVLCSRIQWGSYGGVLRGLEHPQ